MSADPITTASPPDSLALLAPGGDAFLWIDRDGRALVARDPRPAFSARGDADATFLGISDFDATPSRVAFVRYATVLRTTLLPDDDVAAPAAPRLCGRLDDDQQRSAWRALIGRALDRIATGAATKIVLARRVRLTLDRDADARALARRMTGASGTFRYLVRRGDVLFAGATPERLIEKHGDAIRTEAVAGTAPLEHEGTPLDQRDKDRREHHAVVTAIDRALAPHALALEHAAEPVVRRAGRVQHLVTPFEGRVDPATHVLALAQVLHPTPAVAGTPRDIAVEFITRNEGFRRGWFAGPVGWFDGNGDGEFAVALRCVRIEGRTLEVFAGAGIVAGSDADAEFDETTLKMRSTLASLGFEVDA